MVEQLLIKTEPLILFVQKHNNYQEVKSNVIIRENIKFILKFEMKLNKLPC